VRLNWPVGQYIAGDVAAHSVSLPRSCSSLSRSESPESCGNVGVPPSR
jgi:hypothetical protein